MDHPNRRISNRYLRHFLQAIEEEMGVNTLRMVLRQAGMDRHVTELPPLDRHAVAYASELAALQQMIRAYYGSGARGSLNRIGRATWRRMVTEASLRKKIRLFLIRLMPLPTRPANILQELLEEIREPDGQLSIHLMDADLILVDNSGDFTHGRGDEENICWVTQGMIQEALSWATGQYLDVEETSCRATGSENCTFKIHLQGM